MALNSIYQLLRRTISSQILAFAGIFNLLRWHVF